MPEKFIDIEKVISDKNPKLLKWMPGFLLKYIKRILHEDDINEFLHKHSNKYGADFCDAVIKDFDISYDVKGAENIPETGGCILASNHPLGGMDAMTIVSAMQDVRQDIRFIVNDILMNMDNLKGMFVGVNKVGKNRAGSLKKVDETFASDKAIFVFPAGLVSRKVKGKIEDLEWKKTFVTRAKKHKQPIIPVHVDGKLTNFFYNIAILRKFLGIKLNIEMFYLVNELYKQKGLHVPIKFGESIPPEDLDNNLSDKEWAEVIKQKSYALRDE